ncbi:MAG TPA: radical SAM protein [Candidatus Omnitrophota bacterium]|nr:radical SAM protein [Candidatus Omnitrophota bacterium]
MHKILFVIPPYVTFDRFVHPTFNERVVAKKNGFFGSVLTDMPIGVLSLSAYLKKYNPAQTQLLDFNILLSKAEKFEYQSFSELFRAVFAEKKWMDYAPDIIGISTLFTPSYYSMLDLAAVTREIYPKALIVAGGGVPTNMYQEIFSKSSCFDALCYGEGEKPFRELIEAKDKTGFLETSRSWITKRKTEHGESFQHDFIHHLDEIPFCDYGLCNIEDYGLNPAITAYNAGKNEKERAFHVMTSRGCPFHCCFCASHTVHGRSMRYNSIARIREDFKKLRDEYGAKTLVFQDDHFMADKQRVYAIIDIVKELGVKVVFQNSLALYALDRSMLEALKSAGLDQLVLSIESGSSRVLKEIMHKPFDLSMARQVVKDCRDLGIYTNANILIGLPGETKKDIEDTREFLRTLDANWYIIFCATPLLGSEMFKICLEKGYFKGHYMDCDYKKAIVETEDFTTAFIEEKAYALNLELNFVENSDLRHGRYETALKGFENAIRAKNDHAFGFYFAAKCCKMMDHTEKHLFYKTKYQETIEKSSFWRNYAKQFGLISLG